MVTEQHVEGGWTELKGQAKQNWGDLNDDELKQFEGSLDEFFGLLQRKTGDARVEIERWFSNLGDDYRALLARTTSQAREYMHSAGEGAGRLRDQMHAGQIEAERFVRRRPGESVAVAFGVGIITGVVVGLLTKSR
ncbi:CsbD family protein [Botrimarina sp.]|uniref:CsbD family protein n=1 Tax=Botrimarina sp. TaxID=2795802 RepID=UPI0032ED0E7B